MQRDSQEGGGWGLFWFLILALESAFCFNVFPVWNFMIRFRHFEHSQTVQISNAQISTRDLAAALSLVHYCASFGLEFYLFLISHFEWFPSPPDRPHHRPPPSYSLLAEKMKERKRYVKPGDGVLIWGGLEGFWRLVRDDMWLQLILILFSISLNIYQPMISRKCNHKISFWRFAFRVCHTDRSYIRRWKNNE